MCVDVGPAQYRWLWYILWRIASKHFDSVVKFCVASIDKEPVPRSFWFCAFHLFLISLSNKGLTIRQFQNHFLWQWEWYWYKCTHAIYLQDMTLDFYVDIHAHSVLTNGMNDYQYNLVWSHYWYNIICYEHILFIEYITNNNGISTIVKIK